MFVLLQGVLAMLLPDSESRIQKYNNPLIFSAKSREPYCLNLTVAGLAQSAEPTEK